MRNSHSARRTVPWPLLGMVALLFAFGSRHSDRPEQSGAAGADGKPRGSGRPEQAAATGAFGNVRSTDEPHEVHQARADESGRGRSATKPTHIPWSGWKDIFWRTFAEISNDRLMSVAGGVVFFGLLAIFPAITAFVSLYGLFADAGTISQHLSLLADVMPAGGLDIVREQIERIVAKGGGGLTFGFIFGLAFALWSANAGMKAIMDALNVIYDEEEKRSFIKLNIVSLMLTVGAIVVLLLALAGVVVLPLVLAYFGLGSMDRPLLGLLRWPALFLLIIFGLAVLYRFGPSREVAQWKWVSVGSVFATAAWLIGSILFSWYLANFADYDATYGSLGAAIGLMMWMWISVVVILVGAELNAEIEHQTARDTTTGAPAPMGARGAAMADTVGARA